MPHYRPQHSKQSPTCNLKNLRITPRTYAQLRALEERLRLDQIGVIAAGIDLLAGVYLKTTPGTAAADHLPTAPRPTTVPESGTVPALSTELHRTLNRLKALTKTTRKTT